ncbi:PR-1-like protein [Lindgomyces ingoldianus]|uniref:PR-1-like protein n=1 Tax=Lindgomyces ingoldianus TaxID=673940 RepID=A0ACB6R6U8_9PLEO|nr:PR-1-like protein [Lindgomyces ingoldianus]KAF2474797.1 PR-1-like protein [Lindgomyces ingoldianus]
MPSLPLFHSPSTFLTLTCMSIFSLLHLPLINATLTLPRILPLSLRDQQASAEYTNDKTFKNAVLNVTNTYRRLHNATAVTWNDTSAKYAQEWGNACVFKHSGGPTGENLSSGYPNLTSSLTAWYYENIQYSYTKAEFSKHTGHFTQLVWKATTTVGCSRTECNNKNDGGAPGWYVVCEYYPPGNVIGYFKENVQQEWLGKSGDLLIARILVMVVAMIHILFI